jgi:hypothetical protein
MAPLSASPQAMNVRCRWLSRRRGRASAGRSDAWGCVLCARPRRRRRPCVPVWRPRKRQWRRSINAAAAAHGVKRLTRGATPSPRLSNVIKSKPLYGCAMRNTARRARYGRTGVERRGARPNVKRRGKCGETRRHWTRRLVDWAGGCRAPINRVSSCRLSKPCWRTGVHIWWRGVWAGSKGAHCRSRRWLCSAMIMRPGLCACDRSLCVS